MHPTAKAARVAGAIYLLTAFTAPFSLIYVPRATIVKSDASATAGKLLAHETLFRAGIAVDLISGVIFVLAVMALYRLLSGVNKMHASLMVILVLMSVTIGFVNELNNVAALTLFRGADFLAVFEKPQRDAFAMLFLRLHSQGLVIDEMLWGLWLFPFGALVFRSRFLPRILGVWLILNGFAYVAVSLTGLLYPQYHEMVFNNAFPAILGELAIMLWLVIMGAKEPPPAIAAA
jgi:hypothetical protein